MDLIVEQKLISGEICPYCTNKQSKTKDSRVIKGERIRRKECEVCGRRWSTKEILFVYDYREEERNCMYCGKGFKPRNHRQKTCGSEECKRKLNNLNVKKWSEEQKKKPLSLSEISRRARACGMTYGEYVKANGL